MIRVLLEVENDFDVLCARNAAKDLARKMGFSIEDRTRIDLAVAELANNLIRHAVQGKLIFCKQVGPGHVAFIAVAMDSGPGIGNLEQALRLGFSTKGGLGTGLSTVKEVMDEFSITSRTGACTLIKVRKWLK